jgi:ElaA protein
MDNPETIATTTTQLESGYVKARKVRNFIVKKFDELTTRELYEIYKLRSKVFVVEQNCAYQDVDDKDLAAAHLMLWDEGRLEGYARVIPPGMSYAEASIGRVLVEKVQRGQGAGKILMEYALAKCRELYNSKEIVISAQTYLTRFYEQLGFSAEGETYWEDDIPHVRMRYQVLS